MNQNKKVLQFVLLATICLFALSCFVYYNSISNKQLQNISIINDVLKKETAVNKPLNPASKNIITTTQLTITNDTGNTKKKLEHFNLPNRMTNFSIDTNSVVLKDFIKKIIGLKKNKKGKIRIAYLGDSMIEGDLVSQTLRRLLQKYFGGYGVGFVPITSAVAGFRTSVKHSFSGKWNENNFKTRVATSSPLFLSGKTFFASGYNWMDAEDKTYSNKALPLKKYLLCGYKPNNGQIAVNSIFNSIKPLQKFNAILLDSSIKANIKLEVSDGLLPLYGISFESQDGVIVDNFSFRGMGGFEFINIDIDFLSQINATQPYDLIIMQYGVNVLNKPNNNSFNWYHKSMIAAINKLKKSFANAEFLLISAADKSFKYSNGIHTAIGMDSLIATQERIAFDANIAFFNTYSNMGGYNSMVNWATGNPKLAAKDYTHLNANGADVLGNNIYNSIMYEFKKTEK